MRETGLQATPPLDDPPAVRAALGRALARPLPGVEAQLRMAPSPRPGWRAGVFPPGARPAGVLVLLYPGDRPPPGPPGCRLVLTLRTSTVGRHPGQVSLPGGEALPGEDPREAALREAAEEVGVEPAALEVLGNLTRLHVPVSGFVLHPVVAFSAARPALRPGPGEVERILEPSLPALADPARQVVETWRLDGRDVRVPFFAAVEPPAWGATAMILAELLAVLGRPPCPRETGRHRDVATPPGGGVAPGSGGAP